MKIIQIMPVGELPEYMNMIGTTRHGMLCITGCALVEMEDGRKRIFPIVFTAKRPGVPAIMACGFLFWEGVDTEVSPI